MRSAYTRQLIGDKNWEKKTQTNKQQKQNIKFIQTGLEKPGFHPSILPAVKRNNELTTTQTGGRNSSVGSAWARCQSVAGSILLWGHFPVEGIFPLELTWVQTPFPQNSFGWEYKPRSSLCTHAFHRTDSKDPDVHVLDGWMPATKTHPARTIHEDGMWLP